MAESPDHHAIQFNAEALGSAGSKHLDEGPVLSGAGIDSSYDLNRFRGQSYWSVSDTMTFSPHEVANAPAVLAWRDLTVTSKGKTLLNKVSGRIAGGFVAVMGPSGSGKSTLLNTLACRLTRGMEHEGELRLNGRLYSQRDLKLMSGFVMQDDLMNGALTVHETVFYAGELRLPRDMTPEHRKERVEEAIAEMGCHHVRDVVIGDALRKGISGGERKRVAVAMELITHPQLLFLDEPTSGLDSVTALSLCQKLKMLAASGRTTVICTIHQPQSKLFALFDNLCLLKSGDIVYLGPAAKAITFFAKAGFPCPQYTNPADHLLDVITPALGEDAAVSRAKAEKLKAAYKPEAIDLDADKRKPLAQMRDIIPWHKQFQVGSRCASSVWWMCIHVVRQSHTRLIHPITTQTGAPPPVLPGADPQVEHPRDAGLQQHSRGHPHRLRLPQGTGGVVCVWVECPNSTMTDPTNQSPPQPDRDGPDLGQQAAGRALFLRDQPGHLRLAPDHQLLPQ